jgi:BlaI family penicillinase repressor
VTKGKTKLEETLSRRERQVMDILFRRGEATVAEVMGELPDPPTYSAVRSVLRILV